MYETYFPLPFTDYITFNSDSKFDSKNYSYWQDILDLLTPVLSNLNIKIVQIGGAKEPTYKRVVNLLGQTNCHQLAHVIKNAKCHIGPDSFSAHIASTYDVPIVALFSCIQAKNAGPYFGTKSRQILFEGYKRVGNKKPSYSAQESPKSINTIMPEEIANAVFKLLGIDFIIPFKTVHIGSRYNNSTSREVIPNSYSVVDHPELPIEIRADLFYDEKKLAQQLNYFKKAIVVVEDNVNLDLLKAFKPNIQMVAYKVGVNDNPEVVKQLINLGFQMVILSELSDEEIQAKKIKYFEYGNINKVAKPNPEDIAKLKPKIDKLYYRTNKLVISNDKAYNGYGAEENNVPLTNDFEYQKVIDCKSFWKDLDFMTIIEKN